MDNLPALVELSQISHFNNPYRYLQQVVSRAIELSSAKKDPITGLVVSRLYTDVKADPELSEVLCAMIESRYNTVQHEFFKNWVEGGGGAVKDREEESGQREG